MGKDCCDNHDAAKKKPSNSPMAWLFYIIKNINQIVWDAAKYFFYILVGYLMPMCSYRFFFKYGVYPWNDFSFAIQYSIFLMFTVMAFWSHIKASPPNDPGHLKWEHFRTPEQLNDYENKKKWADPKFRERQLDKKEENEVDEFDSITNKLEC